MLFRNIYRQVQLLNYDRVWSWSRFLPVEMLFFPCNWTFLGRGRALNSVTRHSFDGNDSDRRCDAVDWIANWWILCKEKQQIYGEIGVFWQYVILPRNPFIWEKRKKKLPPNGPLKFQTNKWTRLWNKVEFNATMTASRFWYLKRAWRL